jgi:hypothetical protein
MFTTACYKRISTWAIFSPKTIHGRPGHANPLPILPFNVDYKLTLPKYNVNNSFVGLKICATGQWAL